LGKGAYARVYRCCSSVKDQVKDNCAKYVVKLFHQGKSDMITKEEKNLSIVNEKFQNTFSDPQNQPDFMFTTLIGKCTDADNKSNALLLYPEGKQFLRDVLQIRAAHLMLLCGQDLFEQDHLMGSTDIFCTLIDALRFLHNECKLVHRDVKLSNFFLFKVYINILWTLFNFTPL